MKNKEIEQLEIAVKKIFKSWSNFERETGIPLRHSKLKIGDFIFKLNAMILPLNFKIVLAPIKKKSEKQLLTLLSKAGYQLRKGSVKTHADNLGGYMIIDNNTNAVLRGSRYELSLEDVQQFINE